MANLYFILICCLQATPVITITAQRPTTLPPLLFVIAISMIKDFIEDSKRRSSDMKENQRKVLKLNGKEVEEVEWLELKTGDLVKVLKDEYFPADLIMLKSSDNDDLAYVETKNLDGETNLKLKQVSGQVSEIITTEDAVSSFDG
jgi:phospholipid-transporting ATPase